MRYSLFLYLFWLLGRVPGAIWCYFVHSWSYWEPRHRDSSDFDCSKCGREWVECMKRT